MAAMLQCCSAAGLIWHREAPAPECRGRRRVAAVRCSSGAAFPGEKVADAAAAATARYAARRSAVRRAEGKRLVEPLRLGNMAADWMSYKERFVVRCYEVGFKKTATVGTIANLLQEVACNHVLHLGSTGELAVLPNMRKLRLIWVVSRMHIEMYKYPAWSDMVEIETWYQGEGKIGFKRDWIVKDSATDEVIGRATSKWVLMNQDTRKLQQLNDEAREVYLVYGPRTDRLAFPEKNNDSLKKIPKLADPAQYSRLGILPRRADLDMNQHINNVTYIGWFHESMPREIIDTHELQTITIDYKRECQYEDAVDSLTSIEFAEAGNRNGTATTKPRDQEFQQFLHLLKLSATNLEITRARTKWRKLVH
ncbi:hypothetical protein OPV22_029951 [Ensete ventricosum]|uniref:Acyl-[acyl-carrier-protein] hydrolase n=1 Tax=Ensete ventricosum TaxID=4639 RepID=A0AAV8Q7E6_ENSVE|nr:hypothetical protein OPV22_029951 [Ensete ventricosum]